MKRPAFFDKEENFMAWFESRRRAHSFCVEQIPFKAMRQWRFQKNTGNLAHESGKFFKVAGVRTLTNFGPVAEWDQPVIVQPEIGILGIITRKVNGVRYFLMQVKMEPGNVNIIQLSPTLQATKSNYTKVHKGRLPAYLGYFLSRRKSKFLVDLLQTEQGGRFFKKRNRNMIVEVDGDIELLDDFCWLSSRQIRRLLALDDFVNMDARSVLSCAPLADGNPEGHYEFLRHTQRERFFPCRSDGRFLNDLLDSMIDDRRAVNSAADILSWFTELKTKYELSAREIALKNVRGWKRTDTQIAHRTGMYFSVIAVSVSAGNREVVSWDQPLIKSGACGLVGFIAKKINNVLHFLVQAKVEPGNFDIIEMAPTVSCSDFEKRAGQAGRPLFLDIFINARGESIKYSAIQSEEGGRFYHFRNKCVVVVLDSSQRLDIPQNYAWMTLGQMMEFIRRSCFNIEARCLLSCMGLF